MAKNSKSDVMNISMVGSYGSVAAKDKSSDGGDVKNDKYDLSLGNTLKSIKDASSRVAFWESTKTHHHHHPATADLEENTFCESQSSSDHQLKQFYQRLSSSDDIMSVDDKNSMHSYLRKIALDFSLWINVLILATKVVAYFETLSLSILAALVDSILDVVSQLILYYAEQRSSKTRSSAHYPAGASRLEPLGVLSCAALMGFASFGVLKEAIEYLYEGIKNGTGASMLDENWSSFWSMTCVVFVKLGLWVLCQKVSHVKGSDNKYHIDPTIEAVGQDHWNDCLSNAVAAVALLFTLANDMFWILDPIGAIIISFYIIFSWYSTGREQIEQLTGKAAPADFIDELYEMANNFDIKMEVDVVRAYHFGPKFLVELEVVLPKDTLLFESHDLGMELQYEIESREEVERCFVHIDYESRPYDEHVVSKVPELRERYRPYKQSNSAVSI